MTDETLAVTVPDGTTFACRVEKALGIGGEDRWTFTDHHGTRYIGPPWTGPVDEHELRAIVTEWWAMKKALGQQGVNAEKMRDWLKDGR